MPEPIRIGIIGTGLIVTGKHWPALRTLQRDFRVIALANRTPAKAEELAKVIRKEARNQPVVYADYREMLVKEKPDAVSLALPTLLNPEVTEAAMVAGCHVIAEKPIAASLADGEQMTSCAERHGRTLMIAENYRYLNSHVRAAELIAGGTIGPPRAARWSLFNRIGPDSPYYQTAWRQQPAHPGGYLSDGGVHHMAVLRMLLGEAETVTAQVVALRSDLPPVDTLSASIRFGNGALGTYAVTYAMAGPETALQVAGPDGALLVWRTKVELWQQGKLAHLWAEPSREDGLVAMYEDLARALRSGQPPRSTAAEGLADLRLIVAMLRSSETGRAVRVADVA
jgi:predicted dehydrogenase